jgi:fumarate reductase flavoprotein subunit
VEAEATDLLVTDDRVVGVEWEDLPMGEVHRTTAGAVVFATGGFMHDLERVRLERPDLAEVELYYDSWPGADGNGLALLEAQGAATQNLPAVGLYAHGTPDPADPEVLLPMPMASATMWVGEDGERFVDESQSNGFATGEELAALPGGRAWIVADLDVVSGATIGFVGHGNRYPVESLATVLSAEDLASLADPMGVPPDPFLASAEQFNAFARGETTDPWRTDPALADELATALYYAVPLRVGVAKGFGGVDVDLTGRVLGEDGQVLEGAYACGELTGMAGGSLVGDLGFTGSMSAVLLSGRIAGAAAAAEALGR